MAAQKDAPYPPYLLLATCWVNDEVKTVNFGEARLDERMAKIMRDLGDKPAYSIPQAMGGWAETICLSFFRQRQDEV